MLEALETELETMEAALREKLAAAHGKVGTPAPVELDQPKEG